MKTLLKAIFVSSICLLAHLPTAAQRVNYAKYQQATASVVNSTYAADFAVDGFACNFHTWRTGDNPGPHWLEITYPRQVTLASAHLYSGIINANPFQVWQNFRFQYHDGSGWIDIPGSTVTGNTSPEVDVVFTSPATSTRFRLLGSDTNNRTVRQLAMFPPNVVGGVEQGFPIGTDVTLNLAFQRPASASSAILNNNWGPGYAKNAFDGYLDDTSRWLCTNAAGEWLEVDLLAEQGIGSAHVYSGFIGDSDPRQTSQPMPDFKLQSWNNGDWVDIPGANITGNTQVARNIQFSGTVVTSRVRLVTTSAFNGRVQQLLLFPPRNGGYPLGQDATDAPPPSPSWNDFNDSTHRIRITSPDRRLGLVNGSAVFTNNSAGADAVNWQLLLNYRDGSYRIRNVKTGLCLALADVSKATNTLVIGETYSAMPHQDWFLDFTSPTKFRLINAYSGLAIQPLNGNQSLGTPLSVATPSDWSLQQWDTARQHHHPKKGIAGVNNPVPEGFENSSGTWLSHMFDRYAHSSWSYSWGRQRSSAFPYMGTHHTFNPMQWGNFNFTHGSNAGPLETIRNDLQSNPKPVSLMGFNEPDGAGQANMTVAAAIHRWPRLQGMNAPLVSPGPVNAPIPWIDDFYEQADQLGYRVDSTSVHWYKAPNAGNLINNLQTVYNKYGRPIWLTEFSVVRWSGTATWTHADNYNFLAEFLWRAESLPWIGRYSLFSFVESASGPNQSANDPPEAPRSNALRADGTLTPFGELYAGWDGVTSVVNHKPYHLHNRLRYRRVRNPSNGDSIASIAPDASTGADQWFLVPGITENTARIASTLDGRRIRFLSGTGVGLAAATHEQPHTEWRVVANQHGWFFIEHPASSQRLRIHPSGDLVMGPINSTGDDYKWRFASTSVPDPAAPPAIPTGLTAMATSSEINLTWSPAARAAGYTIHRATHPAGPWQTMATGLGATHWADTAIAYDTTYQYTVTAANNIGSSDPSAAASVTTPHANATYASWAASWLAHLPPADRLPEADPDGDNLANLLEYVFLTDPDSPDGNPFRIENSNDDTITLTFPWNWRASAHTWQLRHGPDLANRDEWPVVNPGTVDAIRVGDIDRIRITPAMAHPIRGFYILEVIEN